MSLGRVLLCILFPPLAVLDRGCGSILVVCLLTVAGWVPGTLAALFLCMGSNSAQATAPSGGQDPFHIPVIGEKRWRRLRIQIPARMPYDSAATDPQKNRLWQMGLRDTEFLEAITKGQASWLIDAGMRSVGEQPVGALLLVAVVLLGFVAVLVSQLSQAGGDSRPATVTARPRPTATPTVAPTPTATPTPVPTPTPFPARTVVVAHDLRFSTPSGNMTILEGSDVSLRGLSGGNATIYWNGHSLLVPAAAIREK